MDVTSGAGTAYPSGTSEFIPSFKWSSGSSIFGFLCFVLSFDYCIVSAYLILQLLITLWYLQTLLVSFCFSKT